MAPPGQCGASAGMMQAIEPKSMNPDAQQLWRAPRWALASLLALLPIAVFSFGWALMVPGVTLLVLDLNPERRGLASSL